MKGHRHKERTGTSVISREAETAGTVHPGEVSWGILPVGINTWPEGVNKENSSQQYTGTGQEASQNEQSSDIWTVLILVNYSFFPGIPLLTELIEQVVVENKLTVPGKSTQVVV